MTDRAFRVRPIGLPFLALGLIGGAILLTLVSASSERLLVRFQMFGPGSTFNTVFELNSDGVLETSRFSLSGDLLEKRALSLEAEDMGRLQDLLQEAGYFTADPESLRRPEVLRQLNAVMDLPHWKIDFYRSESEKVRVEVPDRYVGRFHPELREIPYVRVAWQLLEEFDGSWNRSQIVNP